MTQSAKATLIDRTKMNNLDFKLSDGSSQSLYFGSSLSDEEKLQFSLPPKFDGIQFDVRFEGEFSHSESGDYIQLVNLSNDLVIGYSIVNNLNKEIWALDIDGARTYLVGSGEIVVGQTPSEIRLIKESELPKQFSLGTNFPNPFNGTTVLPYELNETTQVRLTVFDLSGRIVNELVFGEKPAGSYQVEWDGRNAKGFVVSSGMYIYSLQSGNQKIFDKLLYLK